MGSSFGNYSRVIPSALFIIFIIFIFGISFSVQEPISKPDSVLKAANSKSVISGSGVIESDLREGKSFSGKSCNYSIKTDAGFFLLASNDGKIKTAPAETALGSGIPLQGDALESWCGLLYHQTIQFKGKLSPNLDSNKQLNKSSREAARISITDFALLQDADGLDYITNSIRSSFVSVTNNLSEIGKALVPAMAIGYTNNFESELSDWFKISGLTHLVAISGSHFVIIISLIGSFLIAFGVTRKATAVIEVVSILSFMALVHPQPSVERAAFMGIIGLAGLLFRRRTLSLTALSITIICLLIIDPYLATNYGFAMSCAATAGIILVCPQIADALARFLGEKIASILSVTISAQLFCGPIIILIYPYFTPYSLIANFLVTPFVAPATILGVGSALISPFIPTVSYILAFGSSVFAYPVYFVAKIIVSLPFAKIEWIQGAPGCALMIAFNLVLYFTLTGKMYSALYIHFKKMIPAYIESRLSLLHFDTKEKFKKYKIVFLRKPVLAFSLTALIILPFAVGGALIIPKYFTAAIDSNWKIAACDIGQGDSSVIKTAPEHAIVIDTGPEDGPEKKCLDDLGIKTIDLLMLSHFHDDHVSGIKGALSGRDVKEAIVSNSDTPAAQANMLYSALKDKGVPFIKAKSGAGGTINADGTINSNEAGRANEAGDGVQWYIFQALEPPQSATKSNTTKSTSSKTSTNSKSSTAKEDAFSNDSSIGAIVYSAGLKMIFLGDMETKAQTEALKQLKSLNLSNFDILKVAHHGSKTQNEKLAELIHPKIAIFEVGKDNTYGHPNSKTISMFENMGAAIIRTDQDKLSGVSVDGSGQISIFKQSI
ncbi:MAG: ComEC/Rec2 family competence protein [Bifidobacteriaceae bacterium]|jgi:competence protein ComEC|nr:ComEC/Rec2 family competence protein [Bifidobacteriaceae bacterium]